MTPLLYWFLSILQSSDLLFVPSSGLPHFQGAHFLEGQGAAELIRSQQPIESVSKEFLAQRRVGGGGEAWSVVCDDLVGRQAELAYLMTFFESALDGESRVVFVAGDAGSGKSSLLSAFTGQASEAHDGLLVTPTR